MKMDSEYQFFSSQYFTHLQDPDIHFVDKQDLKPLHTYDPARQMFLLIFPE